MLRHSSHSDGSGQIGIRNRHAKVHRLAARDYPVHRIEIEQIADHDLRAHVAQSLCPSVFTSYHRTHCFALLQQLFSDRAPYPTDASRRAGDQNWICHVVRSYSFTPNRELDLLSAKRQPRKISVASDYRLLRKLCGPGGKPTRTTVSPLVSTVGQDWSSTK